jgi:hypothetical protein
VLRVANIEPGYNIKVVLPLHAATLIAQSVCESYIDII